MPVLPRVALSLAFFGCDNGELPCDTRLRLAELTPPYGTVGVRPALDRVSPELMCDPGLQVVVGRVVKVEAREEPGLGVVSEVSVCVESELQGHVADKVVVDVPGGVLDGAHVSVGGYPTMYRGQRRVFPLHARDDGTYALNACGASPVLEPGGTLPEGRQVRQAWTEHCATVDFEEERYCL